MKLFEPTTFTWEQLGSLKWGVLLVGIAIGAHWSGFFAEHVMALVALGLVLCIPAGLAWFKEH